MRIKTRLTAIAAMSVVTLTSGFGIANSQIEKSLQFIPKTLDFGTIRETDGKVTKTIGAVNVSPDSTFIISARTSCGCSEAEYDGRMLAPGDTTTVSITYDPTNRPGKFQKTAKIFTGKDRISNTFRITGNVIPSKKHLDKSYPEKAGNLRLSTSIVSVGEMRHAESKPIFIGIYNDSEKPLTLRAECDNDALEATLQPDIVEPFGIATLSLMLKGRDIPTGTGDFKYTADIKDSTTGETLVSIPVGGTINDKTH